MNWAAACEILILGLVAVVASELSSRFALKRVGEHLKKEPAGIAEIGRLDEDIKAIANLAMDTTQAIVTAITLPGFALLLLPAANRNGYVIGLTFFFGFIAFGGFALHLSSREPIIYQYESPVRSKSRFSPSKLSCLTVVWIVVVSVATGIVAEEPRNKQEEKRTTTTVPPTLKG